MGTKIGSCLTALGLCSLAFYSAMMATGILPIHLMPQFLVSSIIFLSSGRIMRKAARALARDSEEKEKEDTPPTASPADWPWLTGLLNFTGALLVIGIMAIFLMKPLGVSLKDVLAVSAGNEQFFATAVP
ncbi:MAG: hypothetical protein WDA20_01110 [Desulfuromonadales bacterium]